MLAVVTLGGTEKVRGSIPLSSTITAGEGRFLAEDRPLAFPDLRDFCAHVASLEVALAAESDGITAPPLVRHPGDRFVRHVRDSYDHLISERHRLLPVRPGNQ
ncbi:hypothetical protein [Nocardia sp. NPDC059239]|uniref:hypothetical protein n=1 Tax=unclassified Nocardia TaxID=2637762 RepID=UPI0036CBB273